MVGPRCICCVQFLRCRNKPTNQGSRWKSRKQIRKVENLLNRSESSHISCEGNSELPETVLDLQKRPSSRNT